MTKEEWEEKCEFFHRRGWWDKSLLKARDTYSDLIGVNIIYVSNLCYGCQACPESGWGLAPREDLPFGLYLWEYLTKLGF
jgi:hypothetical protein